MIKTDNDDITRLFRSRLGDAELPVHEGFWEKLSADIPMAHQRQRRLLMLRVAAAASVLLVLAGASTAFWYFSPKKEEMREAFQRVDQAYHATPDGDGIRIQPQRLPVANTLPRPARQPQAAIQPTAAEDTVPASFSFSFSFSFSATTRQGNNTPQRQGGYWHTANNQSSAPQAVTPDEENTATPTPITPTKKKRHWAVKAELGTTLPAEGGTYKMPIEAGLTVERRLNDYISIESGLLYTHLRSTSQKLHYIGIPLRANFTFVSTKRVELYATVGGKAEKCVAGAPDNSFGKEPIQLAATGGIGIRYKLNERLALFAEPSVSHYFPTDSPLATVRTKRPTNFGLLCGLRMIY